MASSVLVSTLEKASSSTSTEGRLSTARAIVVRCFCPPLSVMPRSPTHVREAEPAAARSRLPRCRAPDGGASGGELFDSPEGGPPLGEVSERPSDAKHGGRHEHEVGHELDELA